ncbi:MAG: hypothetical protein M1817_004915 [Caeruleum heppii]|nr:MAG: hypothetical protein M1817_004915 [Caeruleum heppii]
MPPDRNWIPLSRANLGHEARSILVARLGALKGRLAYQILLFRDRDGLGWGVVARRLGRANNGRLTAIYREARSALHREGIGRRAS